MRKQNVRMVHGRARLHALALAGAALLGGQSQAPGAEKVWPERLRGLCVGKPRAVVATERVFQRMAGWNVNVITVNFGTDAGLGIELDDAREAPPVPKEMEAYRGAFHRLDKILVLARKHRIRVVLVAGNIEGRNRLNVWKADAAGANTDAFAENLSKFWKYTATRYRDEPVLLAYDLLGEPHVKSVVRAWRNPIAPRLIRDIRAVDKETYIIFQPGPWGMPTGYKTLTPLKDPRNDQPRIVYAFHMYAPHNYTHQGIGKRPKGLAYPGLLKMFPGSPVKHWDREALEEYMKPALDFKNKHGVRMYVGEFSAVRWAPGRGKWVEDVISIFEENGVDWGFHSYTGWNGWNPTFPPDAKGSNEPDGGYESGQLKVLKKHWALNRGP